MTTTPPRVFRWWFTLLWIFVWLVSVVSSLYLMVIIGLIDGDRELAREASVLLIVFLLLPWATLALRWWVVRSTRRRSATEQTEG